MKFYRYEIIELMPNHSDSFKDVEVEIIEKTYHMIRETPKGYWIHPNKYLPFPDKNSKWVSKTAKKRFAYPTKAEAMQNFKARTKRRIWILEDQIKVCQMALKSLEE